MAQIKLYPMIGVSLGNTRKRAPGRIYQTACNWQLPVAVKAELVKYVLLLYRYASVYHHETRKRFRLGSR